MWGNIVFFPVVFFVVRTVHHCDFTLVISETPNCDQWKEGLALKEAGVFDGMCSFPPTIVMSVKGLYTHALQVNCIFFSENSKQMWCYEKKYVYKHTVHTEVDKDICCYSHSVKLLHFGAFTKLLIATISFITSVCLSIHLSFWPSTWNTRHPLDLLSWKLIFEYFFKLSRKLQFH